MMPKLRAERLPDESGKLGWWLVPHDPPIGPYATRDEALDAKPGIVAYYRHRHEPGYITSQTDRAGAR
jgi:hypothetical protein